MSPTTLTAAPNRVANAAPQRSMPVAYWLAGTLAVVGIAVAIAWAVLGTLDTIDRVDDFARTAIPGTVSAPVTEPREMLVYYEGSGKPGPRQLGLTVSGPNGTRVSLKTYELKLQYDAPGGRGVASAIASFQATSAGSYQVSATDSSRRRARLAVGENMGTGLASALLGPGLLALAAVSVSTAIAVAAHRRRSHRVVRYEPAQPSPLSSRRAGIFGAVMAAALAALVLGLVMPRGPVTSGQALVTMFSGVLVGGAAGFAMRSRWAMLVAPIAFVAVYELVRVGQIGPTVDGIHLGSVYGILAVATGRLLHGVVLFGPMLVGVSLGRAAAGRWGPAAGSLSPPRHRLWLVARRGILAAAIVGLLALAVLIARPASTDPILGPDGNALAGSVAELTRVEVGGHDQAMMIRGASTENPVLLVLAGGPGGSEVGSVRNFSEALERDFVVATWDQRGTGKSAGEIAPTSTMTVDQMVSDAVEVTNYLRKRFGERKIYLVGNSWGTILGVLAAQQRPDLYHAFIGAGQMVSPVDTDRMFYEDTLAWARRTGDQALVETLRSNGPPPYDDLWQYETALSHEHDWNPYPGMKQFQQKGEMPGNMFVEEYSLMETLHTLPGFMDTFSVLYPQLHGIDFREQAASLEIPVYLVQGAHEARGRAVLADEWFAQLKAPDKQRIVFERSGHKALFEEPDRFHDVMTDIVLARTTAGGR